MIYFCDFLLVFFDKSFEILVIVIVKIVVICDFFKYVCFFLFVLRKRIYLCNLIRLVILIVGY